MKALSVKQPWASLLVHGIKTIETRAWRSNHRGQLWIHSTKEMDVVNSQAQQILKDHPNLGYSLQAIIGMVTLEDILEVTEIQQKFPKLFPQELNYGDFTPGRYGWRVTNAVVLPQPIPIRGYFGLWHWKK